MLPPNTAEGYTMKVRITTTGGAVREADLANVEFLPEHYGACVVGGGARRKVT